MFLLLYSSIIVQTSAQSSCPNGGTFQSLYNTCVYLSTETTTFWDAENRCRGKGGHLIAVHSAFQNSVLAGVTNGSPAWIGLYRNSSLTAWHWSDGTPLNYQAAFDISGCQNAASNYMAFNNYIWSCQVYTTKLPYICQLPTTPILTTTTVAPDCENGGTWDPVFQACLWANDNYHYFPDAEAACQTLGGNLVSIHNQAQLDAIRTFAAIHYPYVDDGYFIGGSRPYYGANFSWVDGTPYDLDVLHGQNCGYYADCIVDNYKQNKTHCYHCNNYGGSICAVPAAYYPGPPGTLAPSPTPSPGCENGGFWDPVFNSCLVVGPYECIREEAEGYCGNLGGDLISIHNKSVNDYIINKAIHNNFVLGTAFWIGGYRSYSEGNWTWRDGTPFDYNNIVGCVKYEQMVIYYENYLVFNVPSGDWQCVDHHGPMGFNFICVVPSKKYIPTEPPKETTKNPLCPNGGEYDDVFEKCIYAPSFERDEWADGSTFAYSEQVCNSKGGYLLTIHSQAQQDRFTKWALVNGYGLTQYTWLAGTRANQVSNFTWLDGTPFDYNNFDSKSACGVENYNKDYLLMYLPNGTWTCGTWWDKNLYACLLPTSPTGAITSTTPIPTTQDPRCSWGAYEDVFDACVYTSGYEEKVFTDSQKSCQKIGGDLISIHSQAQNQRLIDIAMHTNFNPGSRAWIGLNRLNMTSPWTWIDGSPVDYMGNFDTMRCDNDSNQVQLDLTVQGHWECGPSWEWMYYICKLQKKNVQ